MYSAHGFCYDGPSLITHRCSPHAPAGIRRRGRDALSGAASGSHRPAAARAGNRVTHGRGTNDTSVADHAMALMLALVQWCEILVIATPGGAATRHLVDEGVLTALGAEGFLVNIARGSVVDTAALDVIEGEPQVPPALLAQDNVLITPHVAARSPQAMTAMYRQMLENLACHLNGQPLLTPVAAGE